MLVGCLLLVVLDERPAAVEGVVASLVVDGVAAVIRGERNCLHLTGAWSLQSRAVPEHLSTKVSISKVDRVEYSEGYLIG